MRKRTGGCNCGQVRLEISGEPTRVGLCHCQVCRKQSGSLANFFAVWPADCVSIAGETRSWKLSTDDRHFCPACGSSVFAIVDGENEVEVRLGVLDEAPTDLAPAYELWTPRREPWLPPLPRVQLFDGNRP